MVKSKIFLTICLFFFTNIAVSNAITLPSKTYDWSFSSILGKYDNAQLKRGFKVYQQICASCHSLKYVSINSLGKIGFSKKEISSLAKKYNTDINGYFPKPFATAEDAREANNGSIPPDPSSIAKQRSVIGLNSASGADYIASYLNGYDSKKDTDSSYYNPYFANGDYTNMPPMLSSGAVEYNDGSPQTVMQYAKDVSAFLYWCANPNLIAQRKLGFCVISFLIVLLLIVVLLKKEYDKVNRD